MFVLSGFDVRRLDGNCVTLATLMHRRLGAEPLAGQLRSELFLISRSQDSAYH